MLRSSQSETVGGIFTGPEGSTRAHTFRSELQAETPDSYKVAVIEL